MRSSLVDEQLIVLSCFDYNFSCSNVDVTRMCYRIPFRDGSKVRQRTA